MFDFLHRLNGGEILGLAAILGGAFVLALMIVTIGWSYLRSVRLTADLKRDMLARGMSVADIERLSLSETERAALVEADQAVRKAQVEADLKRDMLARGVPIEQIQQVVRE